MFKKKVLPLLLLLLLLPAVTGCDSDSEPSIPAPPQTVRRTILIYMAGQNSLGSYGWLRSDSAEIAAGRRFIADNDRLLVFSDGRDGAKLYEVTARSTAPHILYRFEGEVCSTAPETLAEVLGWIKENRTAEEYALVMWSHADGWIPPAQYAAPPALRPFSFGIDDGHENMGADRGEQMSVEGLADAVEQNGMRLRYIFFDACLMQNMEVAYALRRATDYVVGAPMAIPACGANYTHQLEHGLFSDNPADIIRTYQADVADPAQAAQYDDFCIVLSAVRTDRLEPLAAAMRDALPHSAAAERTSADMTGVLAYQAYTRRYFYRPDNYDAAAALHRILPEEHRERVLTLLNEAIVGREATPRFWRGPGTFDYCTVPDDFCGISLFVPQSKYSANSSGVHGDLNSAFRQTEWYRDAGWAVTGW